jgi:hypothetical protein
LSADGCDGNVVCFDIAVGVRRKTSEYRNVLPLTAILA